MSKLKYGNVKSKVNQQKKTKINSIKKMKNESFYLYCVITKNLNTYTCFVQYLFCFASELGHI